MTKFMNLSLQTWPHEAKKGDLDAFYGNPRGEGGVNPTWESENLVYIIPPWKMKEDGGEVSRIRVHKRCSDSLARILLAVWDYTGRNQATIDQHHLSEWGGSFNYRANVNSPTSLSLHAYGAAFDIAPDENPNGTSWVDDGKMLPRWFIDACLAEGWCWGGDFNGTKDAMHFQATFNAHADAPVPQQQPIARPQADTSSQQVTIIPPQSDDLLTRIRQFILAEMGITQELDVLKAGITADVQRRISAFEQGLTSTKIPRPAPQVQPSPPSSSVAQDTQSQWILGVTATMFGGSADPNRSAYDRHLITDSEFGCALPYHFPPPLPQFEIRGPNGSRVVYPVDVGPWYDGRPGWPYDKWWETGSRPRAESDHRTNNAGIDLTPALAKAVGIDGKGKVDVRYLPATQTRSAVTMPSLDSTAVVDVKSPFQSKINWTQVIGLAATGLTIFTGGKLNLDAPTQLTIVTLIQTVTQIGTVLLRTFGTTAVMPQSLPPQ